MEDIILDYEFFLPIVNSFAGDNEKFYPKCCKVCSAAKDLKNLDHNCSMILRFEAVNQVLAHFTGATICDVLYFGDTSSKCLSEKEISIISYLSGYIFGTFHRRIRFSKPGHFGSVYYQQCLSFLMVGKCDGSIPIVLSEHRHVELLDRGGLWRVTLDVTSIFKVAECYFKCATQKPTTKIDCQTIVSSLMTNLTVLTHATAIHNKSSVLIKKETPLNLVGDLFNLYVRVKSFSFAKDQQQAFKIRQAKLKSRSLRTALKRTSADMKQ